ncbi:hypothetical protein OGAPHI_006186 [Ogataea philodendri]|uniref:CWH43-like N-terminal domain-containing protein n=1 Tax=Ogataea philodendri TaxID=1378263 RepID=A0A9P8NYT6_9ASCO|nr:uncharacterized protein OGAPHI_006186 [Ogataea philodendri]KAH3662005.1 hypothetical protein OGAPHI_006186 [Ogataea philodendri]
MIRLGSFNSPNVRPRWAFFLPLLSVAAWWAMLIAMVVCWVAQGRPNYEDLHVYMAHLIIYLSNVGATNLQGLFIAGAATMGVFFVWTMIEEMYLRSRRKRFLLPSFRRTATVLHVACIIFTFLSSLSIFLVSCLKDTKFSTAHYTFVALFIVLNLFWAICNISLYFIYWKHYPHFPWFKWSACLKLVWLILAIGLAIGYVVTMRVANFRGNQSKLWGVSGVLEWTLCFWFGVVFFILSVDIGLRSKGDADYPTDSSSDWDKENNQSHRSHDNNVRDPPEGTVHY